MIHIEPTRDFPIAFDLSGEEPVVHKDKIAVAANTASLLESLGGTIDMSEEDEHAAHALIKGDKTTKAIKALVVPGVARKLSALLNEYDHQVIKDAQQARTYITNRLVELASCGDLKIEIKALELLGKHSDIGIFTERSEITVTHRTSADLENSIKDRIKRLLHADVVDVVPLFDLDAHLGNYDTVENVEEPKEATE